MTKHELSAAHREHEKIKNIAEAKMFLDDLLEFGHSEMGRPRPPKPWRERFAEWRQANRDEYGRPRKREAQA